MERGSNMTKEKVTNIKDEKEKELEKRTQEILAEHQQSLEVIGTSYLKDVDEIFTKTMVQLLAELLDITPNKAEKVIKAGARINDEIQEKENLTTEDLSEVPSRVLTEAGLADNEDNQIRWRIASAYMYQLLGSISN